MKYPYAVKHDGVWYEAGTEVPNGKSTVEKAVDKPVSQPVKTEKPTPKRSKKTED